MYPRTEAREVKEKPAKGRVVVGIKRTMFAGREYRSCRVYGTLRNLDFTLNEMRIHRKFGRVS